MESLFLLAALTTTIASATDKCPETLLKDFNRHVITRAEAERVFASYFNTEKGFPVFDSQLVYETPCKEHKATTESETTCFFYDNLYGKGPMGIGGFLYTNGKLVKKSYCEP